MSPQPKKAQKAKAVVSVPIPLADLEKLIELGNMAVGAMHATPNLLDDHLPSLELAKKRCSIYMLVNQ